MCVFILPNKQGRMLVNKHGAQTTIEKEVQINQMRSWVCSRAGGGGVIVGNKGKYGVSWVEAWILGKCGNMVNWGVGGGKT